VARGAVLAGARRLGHAVGGTRPLGGRHAFERGAPAEAERLQVREREAAHGTGHVPERIATGIAVGGRVVRRADPQPVEHDDGGAAGHEGGAVFTNWKRRAVSV